LSWRAVVTTLVVAALAGCATPPALVAPIAGWAFEGRLSLTRDDTRVAGLASWQHAPERDALQLRSPLGQTVATLVRDQHGVTLDTGDAAPLTAPDAETLTQRVLGLPLPLSGLVWWVRGEPDPARAAEHQRDATGITQIRQDGWVIDYAARFADGLPKKLDASRDGLRLRLVIDRWQEAPPAH
jgi:outer membrane lipoprotein LolB